MQQELTIYSDDNPEDVINKFVQVLEDFGISSEDTTREGDDFVNLVFDEERPGPFSMEMQTKCLRCHGPARMTMTIEDCRITGNQVLINTLEEPARIAVTCPGENCSDHEICGRILVGEDRG